MYSPRAIEQPVKQNPFIDATAAAGLLERRGGGQRHEVHTMASGDPAFAEVARSGALPALLPHSPEF